MKICSISELKKNFSKILKELQNGEKIAITFGKKKEIVAYLVPKIEED